MEILKFMFSGFFVFLGMFLMLVITLNAISNIITYTWNRFWRHFNIRKHGYPPAHCDADGDPIERVVEKTEE